MRAPVLLERLPVNPIIVPSMLPGRDGDNINGPSLIEAPAWLPGRLARFYLYFAHHRGRYIRLAVADDLTGPWRVVEAGTLSLEQAAACHGHIASPDVHVDHAERRITLYFHGPAVGRRRELTFAAHSADGLAFVAGRQPVADFYFKAIPWRQYWVGMSKGGVLYLSDDGGKHFRRLRQPAFPMQHPLANAAGDVRHVALQIDGDRLRVFHSRIGDAPECIRLATVDLRSPVTQWQAGESVEILRPQADWEGAGLPLKASAFGPASGREQALRDPAVFNVDGQSYLLYAVAGESGIAIARFSPAPLQTAPDSESTNPQALQTLPIDMTPTSERPQGKRDKPDPSALKRELAALAAPGALQQRLQRMDGDKPVQRVYIMGCGRSGTWLLTALMSTFDSCQLVPKELPVEAFGVVAPQQPTLVLKRNLTAYEAIERIPEQIHILFIVRHPFDVLTSVNPVHPGGPGSYYITPARWLGEMLALQYLKDARRPNTLVLRYEDLVQDPDAVQQQLARHYQLAVKASARDVDTVFDAPPEARLAMHGLRKIDRNSLHQYRQSETKLQYLQAIRPRLGRLLDWVSDTFDYDTGR